MSRRRPLWDTFASPSPFPLLWPPVGGAELGRDLLLVQGAHIPGALSRKGGASCCRRSRSPLSFALLHTSPALPHCQHLTRTQLTHTAPHLHPGHAPLIPRIPMLASLFFEHGYGHVQMQNQLWPAFVSLTCGSGKKDPPRGHRDAKAICPTNGPDSHVFFHRHIPWAPLCLLGWRKKAEGCEAAKKGDERRVYIGAKGGAAMTQ